MDVLALSFLISLYNRFYTPIRMLFQDVHGDRSSIVSFLSFSTSASSIHLPPSFTITLTRFSKPGLLPLISILFTGVGFRPAPKTNSPSQFWPSAMRWPFFKGLSTLAVKWFWKPSSTIILCTSLSSSSQWLGRNGVSTEWSKLEYDAVDNRDDGRGVGVGGLNDEGGGRLWPDPRGALRVVWEYWRSLVVSADMPEDSRGWSAGNLPDRRSLPDSGVLRPIRACSRWDWPLLEGDKVLGSDDRELGICCTSDTSPRVDTIPNAVPMFWLFWKLDVLARILEDIGVCGALLGMGLRRWETWRGWRAWFAVVVTSKTLGEEFHRGFSKRFPATTSELPEAAEAWLSNDWRRLPTFKLSFICDNFTVCDFPGDLAKEVAGIEDTRGEAVEWVTNSSSAPPEYWRLSTSDCGTENASSVRTSVSADEKFPSKPIWRLAAWNCLSNSVSWYWMLLHFWFKSLNLNCFRSQYPFRSTISLPTVSMRLRCRLFAPEDPYLAFSSSGRYLVCMSLIVNMSADIQLYVLKPPTLPVTHGRWQYVEIPQRWVVLQNVIYVVLDS